MLTTESRHSVCKAYRRKLVIQDYPETHIFIHLPVFHLVRMMEVTFVQMFHLTLWTQSSTFLKTTLMSHPSLYWLSSCHHVNSTWPHITFQLLLAFSYSGLLQKYSVLGKRDGPAVKSTGAFADDLGFGLHSHGGSQPSVTAVPGSLMPSSDWTWYTHVFKHKHAHTHACTHTQRGES